MTCSSILTVSALIIGGGPAGYTAALYLARGGRHPVVAQGPLPGGQLTITKDVENYPGFVAPMEGPALMKAMELQAVAYGAQMHPVTITGVDFTGYPLLCSASSGQQYSCNTVIIATGAQAKWLGLPSERHFQGYGVSACATCDGFFFRNKRVLVVGGGNTAVEEALFLSNLVEHVTLIHRGVGLRAERTLQDRLFAKANVTVKFHHVLQEILGEEHPHRKLTSVRLLDTQEQRAASLPVDGVFIAIGHSPNTGLFKDVLPMDDHGYLLGRPDSSETLIPGVFIAGDVKDSVYRQAVTAAGGGCMAALDAERFLQLKD